jgi:hypothetical protein
MSNLNELLLNGLKIRPVTKHLVELLLDDWPLTPACTNDFGVDSVDHYSALSHLFRGKVAWEALEGDKSAIEALRKRVMALDEASGNGAMLNALVRQYVPDFASIVHFHTSWDEICGRTEEASPEER